MKILIATQCLPWPLNSGGNAAQFSTLKCVAADHQVTIVGPRLNESHAAELAAQFPSVRFRTYDAESHRVESSVWQAARRAKTWARTFLNPPAPPAPQLYYPFAPLSPHLIEILAEELERGTDLFQAEYVETLSLGPWLPRRLPKIFVHLQLHFVYAERFAKIHGGSPYLTYLQSKIKAEELDFLRCFDATVTFSDVDRQALLPELPDKKIFVSPFPVPADIDLGHAIPEKFNGRFVFVASEGHHPNVDAFDWLMREIWPDIRSQMPAAKLSIIGAWSAKIKVEFAGPHVTFAGFVADLTPALSGGIMLVPVRIGSGIRTKILAGMAAGSPVISTPIGAEGLLVRPGEDLLIEEKAVEFAEASVRLAKDNQAWKKMALAGRQTVTQFYSPESVRSRRNEIFASVVKDQNSPP